MKKLLFGRETLEYVALEDLKNSSLIRKTGRGGYLTKKDPLFENYAINRVNGTKIFVGEGPKHTAISAKNLEKTDVNDIDELAVPRLLAETLFNTICPINVFMVAGDPYENKGFADYFRKVEQNFSGYQVQQLNIEKADGIDTYKLSITLPEKQTANLTVYRVKNMPDRSIAVLEEADYQKLLAIYRENSYCNIFIHCTGGIGRTGVFAFAFYLLKNYHQVFVDSVLETVKNILESLYQLRNDRPGIVRYPEQLQQAIQIAMRLQQLQCQPENISQNSSALSRNQC